MRPLGPNRGPRRAAPGDGPVVFGDARGRRAMAVGPQPATPGWAAPILLGRLAPAENDAEILPLLVTGASVWLGAHRTAALVRDALKRLRTHGAAVSALSAPPDEALWVWLLGVVRAVDEAPEQLPALAKRVAAAPRTGLRPRDLDAVVVVVRLVVTVVTLSDKRSPAGVRSAWAQLARAPSEATADRWLDTLLGDVLGAGLTTATAGHGLVLAHADGRVAYDPHSGSDAG